MDRLTALRNVEDALADFEQGESDLASTERRIQAVLRTFATEFEDGRAAYRASGDERAEGLVVVAESAAAARERIVSLLDESVRPVEVERIEED